MARLKKPKNRRIRLFFLIFFLTGALDASDSAICLRIDSGGTDPVATETEIFDGIAVGAKPLGLIVTVEALPLVKVELVAAWGFAAAWGFWATFLLGRPGFLAGAAFGAAVFPADCFFDLGADVFLAGAGFLATAFFGVVFLLAISSP